MSKQDKLTVDLHSHLFMKKGLGWVFQGDFNSPLKANAESLNQSGIGLIVASLYDHPFLVKSVRDSIREQVEQANNFINQNSEWIMAKNPQEAKKAYENGKKILVLSLEGASGVLDTEKDIEEFVDKLGIKIVTFIHLNDDYLGGSAFVGSQTLLFNVIPYIKSLLFPVFNNGIRINPQGLTQKGKELIELLAKHHVWIDLSHSSRQTINDIRSIPSQVKQPYLISHTLPQEIIPIENSVSDEQLQLVRQTNGLVGLGTAKDFLDLSSGEYKNVGAFEKFIEAYNYTSQKIGINCTMLGPDFNGGSVHLPAPKIKTGTSIDTEGFWNIGQEKDLWQSLENKGVKTQASNLSPVEYFIKSWELVFS